MSAHNLLSKCDRAMVAYIISEAAGTADDTFPAKRSKDKKAPCTICWSQGGKEVTMYSGSYRLDVAISIKTVATDDAGEDEGTAELASEQRVSKVFDLFHIVGESGEALGEAITDAAHAAAEAAEEESRDEDLADFAITDVINNGIESGFNEEGTAWIDTLNLQIVCAPANVL